MGSTYFVQGIADSRWCVEVQKTCKAYKVSAQATGIAHHQVIVDQGLPGIVYKVVYTGQLIDLIA